MFFIFPFTKTEYISTRLFLWFQWESRNPVAYIKEGRQKELDVLHLCSFGLSISKTVNIAGEMQ